MSTTITTTTLAPLLERFFMQRLIRTFHDSSSVFVPNSFPDSALWGLCVFIM